MTAKHFKWTAEGFGGGRVAVALDGDTIRIGQLAGNAPPATPRFLAALVTEDEYAGCGNAHARRVNPWAIEPRYGMSGSIDLRLRVLEDPALADAPVKNVLHISSMNGKLNQGYRGWIGDFWAMMEHWPLPESELTFTVEEVPIFQPANGWNRPESWEEEYPNVSPQTETWQVLIELPEDVPDVYEMDDYASEEPSKTQKLIEMIAARMAAGDWDIHEVRRISASEGFAFDGASGAHLSEAGIQAAAALAAE